MTNSDPMSLPVPAFAAERRRYSYPGRGHAEPGVREIFIRGRESRRRRVARDRAWQRHPGTRALKPRPASWSRSATLSATSWFSTSGAAPWRTMRV